MKVESVNNLYLNQLSSDDLKIELKYIEDIEGTCENFCSFFAKKIQKNIDNRYKSYFEDFQVFVDYTYKFLYKSIQDLSIKTLISEINTYKNERKSNKDVYQEFSNELLKLDFHKKLYGKYPILYQLIEKRIENYFSLIESFLNNLISDLNLLQNYFRFKNQKIASMYLSNGDFHNGGKTTIFFDIGETKIVYKPKNLENDLLLHDIVEFINTFPKQKCKLKHVETVDRGDYGWQRVVDIKKCTRIEEVNNYYYRIGSFLSIFLMLGTDDLHNENIISCGENPYFIDLETLVKTEIDTNVLGVKNFFDEINHSVLSTMLLPTSAVYNAMDCDIGGISSFNEESSTRMKAFQLINRGTDKIALTNREVFMGSGDNHLYLNDKLVYPNSFSEEIIKGFKDTFYILKENIESVKEILKSRNMFSRCVIRPTFVYGSFLDASIHPYYLQDEETRIKLFEHLYKTKNSNKAILVEEEIKALIDSDVPYFHQVGKDLICNQKTIVSNYYNQNLEDAIANRVGKIKNVNIERQVSYIRLSLSTLNNTYNIQKANIFKNTRLISEGTEKYQINYQKIISLLEYGISNKMLWDDKSKSCTWLSVTQIGEKYSLNCANGFIYESGGVLMFYLMLYKHNHDPKYLLYAESIFRGLKEMGMLKQKLNESAFVGTASHLYLAANLYQLTKKSEYKKFVLDSLSQLERSEFTNLDYLSGVSGLLVLLNNLHKKMRLKETESLAQKAIYYLINNLEQFQPETGVAHGYSGIALGLLSAAELLGKKEFIKKANEIILIENKYFIQDEKNWLDLRDKQSVSFGWCRGSSGIALVRAKLRKALAQHENIDLSNALSTTLNAIEARKFKDDSLCHGLYGAIDNLIDVNKTIDDMKSKYDVQSLMNDQLQKTISKGFRYGASKLIESENLFVGLTGVGYLMLRVQNEQLPSIMNLEIF